MKLRYRDFPVIVLVACTVIPVSVKASDDCTLINRIIESGLDPQEPFAAVAGITLPGADSCSVKSRKPNSEPGTFVCEWNRENHMILENMEDEVDELLDIYLDHDGGYDAWEEAEDLIDKANYWIRTYNVAIQSIPYPNSAQRAQMNEWRSKAKRLERRAHAAEQEAIDLDREQEEAEAIHEAKEAEFENHKNRLERQVKSQTDNLYTGMYECFSNGLILDASTYEVDIEEKSWTSKIGCTVHIESYMGPKLSISCPSL